MSDLTNSLKNYLSGFHELSNWNTLTAKEKTYTTCKLASYTIIPVPLIALIVYGGSLAYDSLFGRVSQKMPEKVEKQAENANEFTKKILGPQDDSKKSHEIEVASNLKNDAKIENEGDPILNAKTQELEPEPNIDEEFLFKSEPTEVESESEEHIRRLDEDEEYNEKDLEGFLNLATDDEKSDYDLEEQPISNPASKVNDSESTEIPNRTKYSREMLQLLLKDKSEPIYNHRIVEVVDNGDCFYAAFAAGINQHLQKEYSVQEMRKIVSDEIHRLHEQNPKDNWVKNYLAKEYGNIDSYEDYLKYIEADCDKSLNEHNRPPIWGKEQLDGVILCQHFAVNLNVTELIPPSFAQPKSVDDIAIGANTYPGIKYPSAINIAIYDGHFLGLVPNN